MGGGANDFWATPCGGPDPAIANVDSAVVNLNAAYNEHELRQVASWKD